MKTVVIKRRQVLRGVGGYTLGLPFLSSLVPVPAFAQAVAAKRKHFVALASNHGGVYENTMYPAGGLDRSHQIYPEHVMRYGELRPETNGGNTTLSGILRAPSGVLSPRLVGKMNVIRGIDVPWYLAHHTGGHLGNYARNDGNGGDGKRAQAFPTPTIDQLMAYSDKFYPTLDGIKMRTINTGTVNGLSYNFSSPRTHEGSIQEIVRQGTPSVLFQRLFVPPNETAAPRRQPIVDRVLANYKSLRESNRRLSAEDRLRLDAHIHHLAELERTLTSGGTRSCKDTSDPGPQSGRALYPTLNDIIVMAFTCGTSHIAVMGIQESIFSSNNDNWHQGVAHQWNGSGQPRLVEANRNVFAMVFADLINKLDIEESPGETYLDNALVQWTNESGEETHDSRSRPIITAGSAGGYFKTGLYLDYRNTGPRGRTTRGLPAGLLNNQYLATVMQAMGMTPMEWRNIPNVGNAGYGWDFISTEYRNAYVPGVQSGANTPLPIFKA